METKKKIFSGGWRSQLPDDIIVSDILRRVPVKSLCRWKLVSKTWRSFIEHPVFVDKFRSNTSLQWIRLPPPKSELLSEVDEEYDMDIYIYSIDHNGAKTILSKYVPPPDQFFQKQQDSLTCSYHGSLQLTVFNTNTKESLSVTLPSLKGSQQFWNFEYGFDPLSKKHKVLTYEGGRSVFVDPIDGSCLSPTNFQVSTLDEETLTWRSLDHVPKIKWLPHWVTVANGKIFWFLDNNSVRRNKTPQIMSFDFAAEEFATISLPKSQVHFYFKRPLFEYEGSLCYVENMSIGKQETNHIPINVWMLKDVVTGVWVSMAKNMILSLNGTHLETLGTRGRYYEDHSTMEDAEFSIHDSKLVVATYDNNDQYVYWSSFLNGQCKRTEIIGQPFKHPTMEEYIEMMLNLEV